MAAAVAVWAATIVVPIGSGSVGGSLRLGPAVGATAVIALVWGVVGGVLGAVRRPEAGVRYVTSV